MPSTNLALKVDVDASRLFARMRNVPKKLGFGSAIALNDTVVASQKAVQQRVRRVFITRAGKETYLFGTAALPGGAAGRVTTWARYPSRMYAELSIESRAGSKGGPSLLPIFETGGERRPFTQGAHSVAIPLTGRPARPSIRGPVPPQYTFAGMRLRAFRGKRKLRRTRRDGKLVFVTPFAEFGRLSRAAIAQHGVQFKGEQRTFLLTHSAKEPLGGVFQRIGRGDIRLIWAFRKGVRLDDRLHAADTVKAVAPEAFKKAIRTQAVLAFEHEASRGHI